MCGPDGRPRRQSAEEGGLVEFFDDSTILDCGGAIVAGNLRTHSEVCDGVSRLQAAADIALERAGGVKDRPVEMAPDRYVTVNQIESAVSELRSVLLEMRRAESADD